MDTYLLLGISWCHVSCSFVIGELGFPEDVLGAAEWRRNISINKYSDRRKCNLNALQIKILINIPSSTDDNRCIKSFSCGLILSFAIDCFLSRTFLRSSSPSSSLSLNSSPTCVFSFGGRLPPVAFSASLNAWKWILCVNR